MYEKELKAIKKSNRFRERKIYNENIKDFASNDYLGLSENKILLAKAFDEINNYKYNSSTASQLINGYHPIHKKLEDYLKQKNNFEDAILVGNGFLANIALFESLGRNNDLILIDEEFHASGNMGVKLSKANIKYFKHNCLKDLQSKIDKSYNRIIIAVEGIYSMQGDLVKQDILQFAIDNNYLLIIDEAHSVGVIGKELMGILDYYDIKQRKNIIKMGTLGKAIGSYGAYILSSKEIISFLQNRAKSIIYTTALSLIDTALAYYGFLEIEKNLKYFKKEIQKRKNIINTKSLIFTHEAKNIQILLNTQKKLLENNYLIGAIRPPTVKKPIFRVIARINQSIQDLEYILNQIKD